MTKLIRHLGIFLIAACMTACATPIPPLTPEQIADQHKRYECGSAATRFPFFTPTYNACLSGVDNLDKWAADFYRSAAPIDLCDAAEASPADKPLRSSISRRKINCRAIETKKHLALISDESNEQLCQAWSNHNDPYQNLIDREVRTRQVNCVQVVAMVQERQLLQAQIAQQQAALQQQQQYQAEMERRARWAAFSQALQNIQQQQQQQQLINSLNRPTQTNCMRTGFGNVSCTTY